jgi:hypothetical protein
VTTPYGPAQLVDEIHEWLRGRTELEALRLMDLDLAPKADPPMIVVGPPAMTPTVGAAGGGGPIRYRLRVYVVVAESDRAFRELLEHVDPVVRALDEPPGIAVLEWSPTTFPAGSVELPAYGIDIEVTA